MTFEPNVANSNPFRMEVNGVLVPTGEKGPTNPRLQFVIAGATQITA